LHKKKQLYFVPAFLWAHLGGPFDRFFQLERSGEVGAGASYKLIGS